MPDHWPPDSADLPAEKSVCASIKDSHSSLAAEEPAAAGHVLRRHKVRLSVVQTFLLGPLVCAALLYCALTSLDARRSTRYGPTWKDGERDDCSGDACWDAAAPFWDEDLEDEGFCPSPSTLASLDPLHASAAFTWLRPMVRLADSAHDRFVWPRALVPRASPLRKGETEKF